MSASSSVANYLSAVERAMICTVCVSVVSFKSMCKKKKKKHFRNYETVIFNFLFLLQTRIHVE